MGGWDWTHEVQEAGAVLRLVERVRRARAVQGLARLDDLERGVDGQAEVEYENAKDLDDVAGEEEEGECCRSGLGLGRALRELAHAVRGRDAPEPQGVERDDDREERAEHEDGEVRRDLAASSNGRPSARQHKCRG